MQSVTERGVKNKNELKVPSEYPSLFGIKFPFLVCVVIRLAMHSFEQGIVSFKYGFSLNNNFY